MFVSKCLRDMKEAGHDWVFVADTDELIIFNYIHKDEDPSLYGSSEALNQTLSQQNTDAARSRSAPIRRRLPPLEEHVTIADFIHAEDRVNCYRLPSLNFSAHQDEMARVELPPAANVLLSLVQHRTGPMDGLHGSIILDVSKVESESLNYPRLVNMDNPNTRAWNCSGVSGSPIDYIDSVLRINHYAAGSAERYAENVDDGTKVEEIFLTRHHFNPIGENRDTDYWLDWFIKKVGIAEANRLLFKPIVGINQELSHIAFVKRLKSTMAGMRILPLKLRAATVLNDEGEADEDGEDNA